jgi:hypothetical protein
MHQIGIGPADIEQKFETFGHVVDLPKNADGAGPVGRHRLMGLPPDRQYQSEHSALAICVIL